MAISRLAVLACLLVSCLIFLKGCSSEKCVSGKVSGTEIKVCCPSKECENDKGCCAVNFSNECTTASDSEWEASHLVGLVTDKLDKCPDGCKADAEKPECRLTAGQTLSDGPTLEELNAMTSEEIEAQAANMNTKNKT
eukprot:TRINITY_DN2873_c0_g2_i1.p1 TRINITY_DN2873_c0_g2~~TRINITY_DN2873_c0_g2_i1.p1  ORF type:complete len:138 (+),score=20.27 TRINITY_DN2873_c0_g2_i1:60-473(+)